MDLQQKDWATALSIAAHERHAAVAQLVLAARCNIDLNAMNGITTPQVAQDAGLSRNCHADTEHKGKRFQECFSAG